jgi:hypothetical protein
MPARDFNLHHPYYDKYGRLIRGASDLQLSALAETSDFTPQSLKGEPRGEVQVYPTYPREEILYSFSRLEIDQLH